MAEADLAQIPDVDIDPDGVFKYVLIRVHSARESNPNGQDCPSKEIVRGYKWAEYHEWRRRTGQSPVPLPAPGIPLSSAALGARAGASSSWWESRGRGTHRSSTTY